MKATLSTDRILNRYKSFFTKMLVVDWGGGGSINVGEGFVLLISLLFSFYCLLLGCFWREGVCVLCVCEREGEFVWYFSCMPFAVSIVIINLLS